MPRRAANETLSLQFGLSLIHLQVDEATGVTDVYGCERYVITIGLKSTFVNLKLCLGRVVLCLKQLNCYVIFFASLS